MLSVNALRHDLPVETQLQARDLRAGVRLIRQLAFLF